MNHLINITRIKAVYNALQELQNQVVFVGGAVVSLYAERSAEEVRETQDVDILVEIYTHHKFAELEERLRAIGFANDTTSTFAARYILQGIILDVMPVDEKVLGFSNRWYKEGFKNAILHKIDDLVAIRIFTPPYFLASKLEAFKTRGKDDGRQSRDFEDIVFLLVNRESIWDEIRQTEDTLQTYLLQTFRDLLANPYLEEWIDAHTGFMSPVAYFTIIPHMKKLLDIK